RDQLVHELDGAAAVARRPAQDRGQRPGDVGDVGLAEATAARRGQGREPPAPADHAPPARLARVVVEGDGDAMPRARVLELAAAAADHGRGALEELLAALVVGEIVEGA